MVIINSPNNPTGAVIPQAEFERIYEACRRRDIWLMTDECYSHFTYAPAKPYSIASINGSKPHIIVIGSLSKTFAMTGWRIGYTLAPKPLIDAINKLQSQSTSNPTSIAQYAALVASPARWTRPANARRMPAHPHPLGVAPCSITCAEP
jgi:aspartate aminotransferase